MIVEVLDKSSGAILFKKDQESKDLEKALLKIQELEIKTDLMEEKIKILESIIESLLNK